MSIVLWMLGDDFAIAAITRSRSIFWVLRSGAPRRDLPVSQMRLSVHGAGGWLFPSASDLNRRSKEISPVRTTSTPRNSLRQEILRQIRQPDHQGRHRAQSAAGSPARLCPSCRRSRRTLIGVRRSPCGPTSPVRRPCRWDHDKCAPFQQSLRQLRSRLLHLSLLRRSARVPSAMTS